MMITPFVSSLDIGFWYQLADRKLNEWKLETSPKPIQGYFNSSLKPGLPCLFNIGDQAFNEKVQLPAFSHISRGQLLLANTKEDFSKFDKKAILSSSIDAVIDSIQRGTCFEDSSLLLPFTLLCFADLKKHTFVYWVCFPSIHLSNELCSQIELDPISADNVCLLESANGVNLTETLFAVDSVNKSRISWEEARERESVTAVTFVCSDPSTDSNSIGWFCRNVINALLFHFAKKADKINLVCLRIQAENADISVRSSVQLNIPTQPGSVDFSVRDLLSSSGWEKNKEKLLPKMADLSKLMDPKILSKNAVELNLKLMKWRIVPELDLEKIAQQKCLLLGAGTLGCNVARLLLAWGVTKLTLVDNGRVSYSNPVRQSLFVFEDAMGGSTSKVEAAARQLKRINPSCEVEALEMSIPMPGHAVAQIEKQKVQHTLTQLDELVAGHDCIFLLLDSREARWLPTVLGKFHGKLVVNAALGFDSYLVMRHGVSMDDANSCANGDSTVPSSSSSAIVKSSELGCYFCSDVMAPGDSLSDRTLDQQCTVTRPGTSMIASSLAVEMFASCVSNQCQVSCKFV
ncbi:ubiquitin-like modifier-activating enzyme ATG7 isoform X2 [Symsagittifera roscoffensis]|uniref:ubiquitin-like modifier-activating enzyme ATG7 isoform X2 n=1 Tax=Symsagittifera roscoffensis TaxID=84072 RepID=UPI00307BAA7B